MRQAVLVISLSDLSRDPRVNRQIRILQERYRVVCAGFESPNLPDAQFVPIGWTPRSALGKVTAVCQLLSGRFESFYWQAPWVRDARPKLAAQSFDAIVANDLGSLPLAVAIADGRPIVYDAHEYSPRQFEDRLLFRLLFQNYQTYLCKKYLPQATTVMTVSEGIAQQYARDANIPTPHVVLSLPDYESLEPHAVEDQTIKLVHHGSATRSRRLERMIEMMRHLDERFQLNLILVKGDASYLRRLQREAAGDTRIRFLEPVSMRQLPSFLNKFDIGLAYFEPSTFNLRHVLPNKFFEFIQARLALAIGPSPEMQRLLDEHELGVIAEEFSPRSLAEGLSALTPEDIMRFKSNADRVARLFSTETTRPQLLAIVEGALAKATPSPC